MGLADAVIAAGILAGALYLLYHSLWKGGGSCHGCASGSSCSARARAPTPLVRLGAQARPGGTKEAPPSACHHG